MIVFAASCFLFDVCIDDGTPPLIVLFILAVLVLFALASIGRR